MLCVLLALAQVMLALIHTTEFPAKPEWVLCRQARRSDCRGCSS